MNEDVHERNQRANEAKLIQLIKDASAKGAELIADDKRHDAAYYRGMTDGLRRALTVIRGLG